MLPTVTTKIIKSLKFSFFDVEEIISDRLLSSGHWNGENVAYATLVLAQQLKENTGTMFDIGSGFGSFSIPLASQYRKKLNVYAFEPQRPIFYQLCANALNNSLSNFYAKNEAIASYNKIEKMNCLNVERSCNHGSFSLIDRLNEIRNISKFEDDPIEDVTFKSIDDNYDLKDVVFIKISVCGMESDVLSGMKNTILRNKNPPIIIESWKADFNIDTYNNCIAILKELGYYAYIEKNDFIYATNEVNSEYLTFFDSEITIF